MYFHVHLLYPHFHHRFHHGDFENDPDELRSENEKEFWSKRDPIKKLTKEILEGKFASEEELKNIERKIDSEISESVQNSLNAPEPPSNELTKYIWAED